MQNAINNSLRMFYLVFLVGLLSACASDSFKVFEGNTADNGQTSDTGVQVIEDNVFLANISSDWIAVNHGTGSVVIGDNDNFPSGIEKVILEATAQVHPNLKNSTKELEISASKIHRGICVQLPDTKEWDWLIDRNQHIFLDALGSANYAKIVKECYERNSGFNSKVSQ